MFMTLRAKMTPKSEDEIIYALRTNTNPNLNDVSSIKKDEEINHLFNKFLNNPNLDNEIKEKWKKALSDYRILSTPHLDVILQADKDDKLEPLEKFIFESDLERPIMYRWSNLLALYAENKKKSIKNMSLIDKVKFIMPMMDTDGVYYDEIFDFFRDDSDLPIIQKKFENLSKLCFEKLCSEELEDFLNMDFETEIWNMI